MTKEIKGLIEKIESLKWIVQKEGESTYLLSKFSPIGQDFNINIEGKTVEQLVDDLKQTYDDFDVSYETYLWLDNTGHGANGAPYEMEDVLNDMKDCEQMILDLYNELS